MLTSRAPWLAHYDAVVPTTLAPYPNKTLLDYLSENAKARPGAAALLFKGTTVSWGQLERESNAFAVALTEMGVQRGERVGLLLPNCPQFFVAELGAWKVGAIVAPLNVIYTEHELELALRENSIETIVTLTRFYDRVLHVRPRTSLKRVVVSNIKEYFPPLLKILFTLAREKKDGDRVQVGAGDHEYRALLNKHWGRKPEPIALTQDDPAILLMSGGTTGTPKGVLGRHASFVVTGLQVEAWLGKSVEKGKSVLMLPLPMFHVYANVGVQALSFVTACPIALVPNPRDMKDLLQTINKVKPTFLTGVPTLWVSMMNHPLVQDGKVDIKSIRICVSGAAALLQETKARFEQMTGGRIIEGYSLTEGMMALCVNPVEGENKLGSVGMPLPDVMVRIYDGDDGLREMATGEVGEICFSGLQLMVGFWNRPEETSLVLRDHIDEDGTRRWLHTGDLGYLDEDGYLFIVDRKKDLIKTSGYQVWPREVEEVLATHPAVLEVGVAGVPDEAKGEAVRAYVVLRPGHSATEAELRTFCREQLAPYKVPSKVLFRTELKKSMVGKILRRFLHEEPA